ncbi:MAG: GNAT family N-acetyltransferase [Coriobacteriia bacterium]|nr:GNAT family N-acetyltransferase [Coriobacteriia bacterium]
MDASAPILISRARRADLAGVLRVQCDGFSRIARRFDIDPDILPPLRETIIDLQSLFDAGTLFLVAWSSSVIVGTVRAQVRGDGVVEIGRLAVADGFLRRGIATDLMHVLEEAHPGPRRFELFTGAEATDALALYRGLGYEIFHRAEEGAPALVWLSKQR